MRKVLLASVGMALLAAILVSCESPAAQRELAEAARVRAEADAYVRKRAADADAAAEKAAIRQMELDATHQRRMDALPYALAILGFTGLAAMSLLIWWDLRQARQAPAVNPELDTSAAQALFEYLERRDRALWHALATLARRQQPTDSARWPDRHDPNQQLADRVPPGTKESRSVFSQEKSNL